MPRLGHGALARARRIASSATAETRNVIASSANAAPAPTAPTSTPPTAGPASRSASGRTSWSSALACASSSAGRSSGTIASNAGREERGAGAVERDEHDDVPELEHARRATGRRAGRPRPRAAGPRASIILRRSKRSLRDAADEQEHDRRHGHRDADHAPARSAALESA